MGGDDDDAVCQSRGYASGSPEYVHTVNLVRLTRNGEVVVTREAVKGAGG